MYSKSEILARMADYRLDDGGIGSWLTDKTCEVVFDRLGRIDEEPLPAVQLNQLLVLAHEAPVSDGFFSYYWMEAPRSHPYDVRTLTAFQTEWMGSEAIRSLDHLAWGIHRLYVDGLLYFGNIRSAFRRLREQSIQELREFFRGKRMDTDAITRRGPPLPLRMIDKHARYLISEMACKSYGAEAQVKSHLRSALRGAYESCKETASGVTVEALLKNHLSADFESKRVELLFSASEILTQSVASQSELECLYLGVAVKFGAARADALKNTELYLSMLTDLDVYVATSMREPADFVSMAETCERTFQDPKLAAMNLRYFDPTLSAASGHEDKGLIECLMVKCAKALVYCAGQKESYGKDAEAAMALSLGRPVIFYCDPKKAPFYREVHPLTRLIEFQTGVAVGAMIADRLEQVVELLARIFENRMVYRLERSSAGSLRLIEALTGSVVRIQTGDKLLTETFWNHYHQDRNGWPKVATPVVSIDRARESKVPRAVPDQAQLPLPDTGTTTQLAARSSVRGSAPQTQGGEPRHTPVRETLETSRTVDSFPLSAAEVYDAIAKQKSRQATGGKRREVFSEWMGVEGIGLREGIRLLRFVEATLIATGARSNFVFTKFDLSRWYQQMSDGDMVGS